MHTSPCVACVAGGIRESERVTERPYWRAAKPRVKFPPVTFGMVFACRPLLSLLMIQLNKPIRKRSIRDICTFAVLCWVTRPICRFTRVYEDHFMTLHVVLQGGI